VGVHGHVAVVRRTAAADSFVDVVRGGPATAAATTASATTVGEADAGAIIKGATGTAATPSFA
jgi:hypothetical protein